MYYVTYNNGTIYWHYHFTGLLKYTNLASLSIPLRFPIYNIIMLKFPLYMFKITSDCVIIFASTIKHDSGADQGTVHALIRWLIRNWPPGRACSDHVAGRSLIPCLSYGDHVTERRLSRDCAVSDHVADHALISWLSMHWSFIWGFPGSSACQCRRLGFHPWVGKISWRRKWQPTTLFLPGKSHGRVWYNWRTDHACTRCLFASNK